MIEILIGINFWLVVLFTGALVWLVRKLVPAKLEKTKWFRAILKAGPVLVGAGLACIPGLQPAVGIAKCILLGFIGGTFSQTAYGVLRTIAPEKIKQFIGGKKEE